jgi:tRNA (mo5U34)-methyltransferase
METPKKFRMKITYPDGTVIDARKDFKVWTDYVNITDLDFKGKRVLDIATDEGWWAFWAEMQGAEYVEASDVERGEDYDWGLEKDWDWINNLNQNRGGKKVFDYHYKNLNSKIVYKKESIYQASGEFDVIFAHGLMYHLRHPLLAIDNMRKCCKGFFMFETFVDGHNPNQDSAEMKFYRTTELGPISNWTGATEACYNSWLKDAGFNDVYYTNRGDPLGPPRQIFIGVVDPIYNKRFKSCQNLHYCDDSYWKKVFNKTKYSK